jgi:hypothetical protein
VSEPEPPSPAQLSSPAESGRARILLGGLVRFEEFLYAAVGLLLAAAAVLVLVGTVHGLAHGISSGAGAGAWSAGRPSASVSIEHSFRAAGAAGVAAEAVRRAGIAHAAGTFVLPENRAEPRWAHNRAACGRPSCKR